MALPWSTITTEKSKTRPPKSGGPKKKWRIIVPSVVSGVVVAIVLVGLAWNFSQGPTPAVPETVPTTVTPEQAPTTAPEPTSTTTIPTTTTTTPPTTTTTEAPLGATLVGESYVDAEPVSMAEGQPFVRVDNELFGVKINLPEGTEIRAPADGYFNTWGVCPWFIEERLGVLDCMRMVRWQSFQPGDWNVGSTAVFVMAANLNYPPGIEIYDQVNAPDYHSFGSDFVFVEKGQLLATVASSQPFPIRGFGAENVVIQFYASDVSSYEYDLSDDIAAAFFPAVAAPSLE